MPGNRTGAGAAATIAALALASPVCAGVVGRPLPESRWFVAVEPGIQVGVTGRSANTNELGNSIFTMEAGPVVNVSARSAVGVTGFVRTRNGSEGDAGGGFRVRYRRWLDDRRNTLDVSVGPEFGFSALTGQVAIGHADKIAATLDVEAQRQQVFAQADSGQSVLTSSRHVATFVGVKVGGGYGVVGSLLVTGLAILVAATWD